VQQPRSCCEEQDIPNDAKARSNLAIRKAEQRRLPLWQFYVTQRTHITEQAMFEYPKIHEIRSASDMVHPASTPENPITAAYVLVIRDRSPEEYIDDEFLDWNYILWWRRNYALNRELCLALRAETLVPDGEYFVYV
jgi:hypothetical protein